MNLRILKKTRKANELGDIFCFQVKDGEYMYGRVIRTDAMVNVFYNGLLVYIYDAVSNCKESVPELHKENLLIPPIITGHFMWTKGYFETVMKKALELQDVWPQHCFFDGQWGGSYYDEYNNRLDDRIEPCGTYYVTLVIGVDKRISEALGLPDSNSTNTD